MRVQENVNIILGAGQPLFHAWVITVFWRWSLFEMGWPQIKWIQALALDAMVAIFMLDISVFVAWPSTLEPDEEKKERDRLIRILAKYVIPLILLAIVWVWRKVTS